MAGHTPQGATSPDLSTLTPVERRRRIRLVVPAPAATRTRRNHGTFMLGGQLAGVYSTRSASRSNGVTFELGAGTLTLASAMTPAQARGLARALDAAANAVDAQQSGRA